MWDLAQCPPVAPRGHSYVPGEGREAEPDAGVVPQQLRVPGPVMGVILAGVVFVSRWGGGQTDLQPWQKRMAGPLSPASLVIREFAVILNSLTHM